MQQLQSEQILQRLLRHQSAQFACFYLCLKFECKRGIKAQVRTKERETFKIRGATRSNLSCGKKKEGRNLIFMSKKLKSTNNLF